MADRDAIEWEVEQAIKRFSVRLHYVESSKRRTRAYAVWDRDGPTSTLVSEPTNHAVANKDCLHLQSHAIMEIIDREMENG